MRVKKKKKEQSMTAELVDMLMDDFKREIEDNHVNVGTINNMILYLTSVFYELKRRKDMVLDLVFHKAKTKEEVKSALEGLYAEMAKLEEKIVYLKERSKDLLKQGERTS